MNNHELLRMEKLMRRFMLIHVHSMFRKSWTIMNYQEWQPDHRIHVHSLAFKVWGSWTNMSNQEWKADERVHGNSLSIEVWGTMSNHELSGIDNSRTSIIIRNSQHDDEGIIHYQSWLDLDHHDHKQPGIQEVKWHISPRNTKYSKLTKVSKYYLNIFY